MQTLYNNQLKRKWKFSYRIVDRISSHVKTMVKRLMEPDPKKRLTIDEVVYGEWIRMDSRLRSELFKVQIRLFLFLCSRTAYYAPELIGIF